ncbi:MAG TPA: ParB/RepB/Spo0J family partition protein [Candidatus Xenobia bacterium]|nr:ParB/RepB/Spo0J family partition protein [Candidatus Xenobia bacterium]
MTRKALGKGLSALLREVEHLPASPSPPVATTMPPAAEAAGPAAPSTRGIQEIPLDLIVASTFQPRTRFEQSALEELAQSMRTGGVVQPVIVRPMGESFELVAGERRLRAARLAGLSCIPAMVRVISDEKALELSLIENIQREELGALEQARAFERLASEFALTQEEIARRTGKDRATVANMMRLLKLPAEVQALVEEGKLTAGHARALLKLEDSPVLQRVLAKRMAARRVSVRQAEEMVDRRLPGAKRERISTAPLDPNVRAAQEAMERALGTKVRIVELKGGRGRVEIDYYSLEDLNRIYGAVTRSSEEKPTPP